MANVILGKSAQNGGESDQGIPSKMLQNSGLGITYGNLPRTI